MIDKGNDRVNMVVYDGYVINKMYGCDGELVYNRSDEKYGCDTVYLEDYSGGTYTHSCMRENCDCLIGSVKNLIYRHDGIEETITYLNYAQKRSITSITIGDCVTSLENSVFANWSGVTEVTLSPYLVAIYGGGTYGAFYNCKSLRSITFPQHLRSVYDAFENCSSLSSVTFNDELKYLGANSFYGCTSLTDVEMPNSVVEVGIAAFNGCTSLSSVTLSSGLTEIQEHTFEGCSSLTDIVIPNNITIIRSSSFSQCTSLSSLTLSEGLLEIEEGCINGCFNLKSLTFPSTFSAFTYGQAMFSNTGVESVTFLNPTPPIVSHGRGSIGDVFVGASQLTKIYVPCDALMTYKNAWASEGTWLTNKLHPIQGSCPYPTYDFMQKTEWVYKSAEYSFERKASTCPIQTANAISGNESRLAPNCIYASNFPTDAHTVIIGDEVNIISNNCFKGWSGLIEASISMNVNTINGGVFQDCPNLKRVNLYAITPPSLDSNRTPFSGSTNCLIYVPCSALDAYRNSSDWAYLRSRIRPMDEFCPAEGKFRLTLNDLTTVTAACDASSAVTSGEVMVHYYDSLVSASIGECVTSIGTMAFNNCTKLSDVVIGDNVTSIDRAAFNYCTSLTTCTIGSGVISIGQSAFSNCTNLKTLTIPSGVNIIGNYAFSSCSGLTSMIIEAVTPPSAYSDSFYNTSNCIYYVPSQSVDLYKHTAGWSSVASRIQPIGS